MKMLMNKFLIVFVLILFGLSAFAVITRETQEIYTAIFISRFYKCIPCKMEQTIASENGDIKIQRFLKNWQAHKCRYAEIRTQNEKTEEFSCNLSREQVNSLVAAMKADPMGENEAAQAWESVKKDKNTCQISE